MSQPISLWGAQYSDVGYVDLPRSPSVTARFHDVTDTTATAADVAQGKYFYTSQGVRTAGTASGGGGGGLQVATATETPASASTSIHFAGLSGEPSSFYVVARGDLATAAQQKVAAVTFDGEGHVGQLVTNASNAQASHSDSFSHAYSDGTLTVTATGAYFQPVEYTLVYTYGGGSGNVGTSDVQVGSGATSITFDGLPDEPTCWSLVFKSDFSTSSGYTRAMAVANDGTGTYGIEMGAGAQATEHWTATYSNGSLTITSQGTNAGGYFHQPGTYHLTYAVGGKVDVTIEPLTVTQNGIYAESGKAYSPVTVNVSGGGGSVSVDQVTWTNSSTSTVSHQFTGLKGTPKFAVLRCTAQLTRSSSNTYYYIADIVWDGTDAFGNYHLRSNGSYNDVPAATSGTHFTVTTGTNSITFASSASSRSSAPGSFYNGAYELTYVY